MMSLNTRSFCLNLLSADITDKSLHINQDLVLKPHYAFLLTQTNSNIQTLFLGIDGLCKKYSQETSQISEFQEKHRRRLVAFYREKISQLEESLRKSVLQIKRLQSMRSSQQAAFNTIKTSVSTKPNGYLLLPPNSSLPDRIESMEIDLTPPARKPEMAAGPSRISLISPPQDGRMGSVSCRGSQHLSLTPSHASMTKAIRVPPLQMPYKELSPAPASQLSSRAAQGPSPSLSSSWTGLPRQPISISGLLQRQCAGSASPGGMDSEKMNPFLPSTPANLCSAASPWHVCVPR
ncbi:probable E3 SUMO-protein ligase RNF212 isoform X5 [Peromyscus californicus insignis]|uniref:probable E3 SUMO-protein ligase RNF212 isoform X5 n=1 Tax=Peromyscus californicus insignis TaxID=564181 RepID=UPI0022A7997C|nr:probable E3 SUMO-protein ligase RNF212 isoform X5 [Peromyscus californicus insignis]